MSKLSVWRNKRETKKSVIAGCKEGITVDKDLHHDLKAISNDNAKFKIPRRWLSRNLLGSADKSCITGKQLFLAIGIHFTSNGVYTLNTFPVKHMKLLRSHLKENFKTIRTAFQWFFCRYRYLSFRCSRHDQIITMLSLSWMRPRIKH